MLRKASVNECYLFKGYPAPQGNFPPQSNQQAYNTSYQPIQNQQMGGQIPQQPATQHMAQPLPNQQLPNQPHQIPNQQFPNQPQQQISNQLPNQPQQQIPGQNLPNQPQQVPNQPPQVANQPQQQLPGQQPPYNPYNMQGIVSIVLQFFCIQLYYLVRFDFQAQMQRKTSAVTENSVDIC